jgi:hypothetical protein
MYLSKAHRDTPAGIATFTAQRTPRPQRALALHTACSERTSR